MIVSAFLGHLFFALLFLSRSSLIVKCMQIQTIACNPCQKFQREFVGKVMCSLYIQKSNKCSNPGCGILESKCKY